MAKSYEHGLALSIALSRIIDRAASSAAELRRDERVLYTVAEFWAAVRAHELASHLETDTESQLLFAEVAFTEMGATHVGGRLRSALHRIRANPGSWKQTLEIVQDLERELIATDDPVEQLLTAQATQYIRATSPTGYAPRASI